MKKGEVASVTVKHPYAYGHVGNAELAVPGGADLVYRLTLEDFEQAKYKYEMNNAEKLDFAEKAKEMGTDYFKAGKYELAAKKYKQITEYLEPEGEEMDDKMDDDMDDDSDAEDKEPVEEKKVEKVVDPDFNKKSAELIVAGFSNQALCYLKLSQGMDAFKACESALKLDPSNIKALFRRGQASEMNQEFEEAIGYYKAVLEVDPKNTVAANKVKFCRNKINSYKASERKKYANMFERTNFKEEEPVKDSNKIKPDFSDDEADDEGSTEEEEAVPQDIEV